MTAPAQGAVVPTIDPRTQVGPLALNVADLARSLVFYTNAIGLAVLEQSAGEATLGSGDEPLLVLREQPGARAWPRGGRSYTGLYHFALLLPTRADLGRWLRHWLELGLPLPGQGDHFVSEALYLEDPDGHGIEIYRDRPRSEWTWVNGQVQMGVEPVDIHGLLQEAARVDEPWNGLPDGTRVGHIHLQVGDIRQAADFYTGVLGFESVAQMPSALFVSAGGYHHHIGANIWHSRGAGLAPEESVRLLWFTIELPDAAALDAVRERLTAAGLDYSEEVHGLTVSDPWSTPVRLHVMPEGARE
jgi:catechol 2,3-dioxygenase